MGLLKMLAGQIKMDFLITHTKKILIVEPSSQSCRINPKHFTTRHTITKWVECVCRANQCQTFAFKALRRFESPLGSTRALCQSTDSHDSAVTGHWFALLMHTLTDPDAEMAETPSLPAPNSDVHALHLMCHWTTIIRRKDIKKWKKVGERQTDRQIDLWSEGFCSAALHIWSSVSDSCEINPCICAFRLECVHSFKAVHNNQAVSLQLNKQHAFNSNSLTAN